MKVRRRVLGLLAALSVITYLDRVCISVAGPRIQEELGLSPTEWGWVVGVFAVAYGAFEIPGGMLADRYGSRRTLAQIVTWWSAFTALTGVAKSYSTLLLTRFCFGAGEAGAYPSASAVISRWFPASERGGAFGIVWMSSQVGGALAPLLVVPIQMQFGWRASFYVFGAVGVLWAAVWFRWFRETPEEEASVTATELAEIRTGSIGSVLKERVPLPRLLASGTVRAVLLLAFAYCYAMYFFIAWAPTYLVQARGFSEPELALSTAPFVLGALANVAGGWASDYAVRTWGLVRGRRAVGVAGLVFAAACLAAALGTDQRYLTLALLAACYAGITFQQPAVWAVCLDIGGRAASGTVSGAMNTAGQIGSFLLSLSYGRLAEMTGDYDLALLPVVGALIFGSVVWLWIDPSRRLAG